MAFLMGGGKPAAQAQAPVIPPPAPVRDDVGGAASGERQRIAALRGRGATMLSGDYAPAPSGQRVLLGMAE